MHTCIAQMLKHILACILHKQESVDEEIDSTEELLSVEELLDFLLFFFWVFFFSPFFLGASSSVSESDPSMLLNNSSTAVSSRSSSPSASHTRNSRRSWQQENLNSKSDQIYCKHAKLGNYKFIKTCFDCMYPLRRFRPFQIKAGLHQDV